MCLLVTAVAVTTIGCTNFSIAMFAVAFTCSCTAAGVLTAICWTGSSFGKEIVVNIPGRIGIANVS